MTLTIKIWDVQKGLAVYANTPNGKHIIIDAGTGSNEDKEFYPLYHLNKNYGLRQIDYAIITHPHKDHIQEIKNLDALKPKVLYRPSHITKDDVGEIRKEDDAIFNTYFSLSERYNQSVPDSENPKNPDNNGGVIIKTFHPNKSSKDNLNNHSIVTLFEYATSKVLVPGDNETSAWSELLEDDDFKNSIKNVDVFIAPHHGRESAFHNDLFNQFTPKVVIISDGPVTETNASSKYSNIASGWMIFSRSDSEIKEERKCISTRKDGMIQIKMGYNEGNKPFLNITKT